MPYFGIPIRNGLPIGLGSVAALSAVQLFSPLSLFTAGEQGVWYDPSDFSTLFQDSAGTTPVTAVEQPVGRILDKSGRGNHAFQTTSTSRPVLSARYNLLTNTGFSGAVAGTPGTAPTGWILVLNTGSISSVSGDRLTFSASASRIVIGQSISYTANTTYKIAFAIRQNSGLPAAQIFGWNQAISGAVESFYANGILQPASIYVPSSGDVIEYRLAVGSTAGSSTIRLGAGCAGNVTGVVELDSPDLRVTNDAAGQPAYQRVNTATDYDTTGFKPYLRFDGTDDWMQTNNINFTATDKMTVFAGVRKLADPTATSILLELSSTTVNPGTFGMQVSRTEVGKPYAFESGGSIPYAGLAVSGAYAAPDTKVLTGQSDISGDSTILRVNGTQAGNSTSDQGTGNYGNYPLYIGRRGGVANPFNGRIYGLIVRGAQSTAQQITNTENWLNQRTGAF